MTFWSEQQEMNLKCRDTVNVDVNVLVFNYLFIFQEMESCNCCTVGFVQQIVLHCSIYSVNRTHYR